MTATPRIGHVLLGVSAGVAGLLAVTLGTTLAQPLFAAANHTREQLATLQESDGTLTAHEQAAVTSAQDAAAQAAAAAEPFAVTVVDVTSDTPTPATYTVQVTVRGAAGDVSRYAAELGNTALVRTLDWEQDTATLTLTGPLAQEIA